MTKYTSIFIHILVKIAVIGMYITFKIFIMSNKFLIIAILWSALLLGGCSSHQKEVSSLYVLDFTKAYNSIEEAMLSDYVSSIRYVPLETSDSVLIRSTSAHNSEITENYIFVPSGDFQSTIYIFNNEGRYLRNIGRKGRGPGEYLGVASIRYFPESNTILVRGGSKSVFYSLSDGAYVKQVDVNDFFDRSYDVVQHYKGMTNLLQNISSGGSIFHNDSLYVIAANNTTFDQYFLILDSDLNLKCNLNMGKTTLQMGMPDIDVGGLYINNNTIYAVSGLADTIYKYSNNKLTPHIAFNYGEHYSYSTHPIRDYNFFRKKGYSNLTAEMSAAFDIFELNNGIIGWINLPKSVAISKNLEPNSKFVFNKQSRKIKIIKYSKSAECSAFTNDIDGGMPFWPTKQIGNKLYQFVDAVTFIEMSKKYNSPRMKEIAATLTDESNPVLIEATLKNSLD